MNRGLLNHAETKMSKKNSNIEDSLHNQDPEQTASFWGEPNLEKNQGETLLQQVKPSESPSTITVKSYVMTNANQDVREDADYEIIDTLGKGGMGDVYLARQVSMDRNVAVKMIKPKKKLDDEIKARFLSEAAVTGDLDHPNIVPIHALGCNENGDLFYSMKRVVGEPWSKAIDRLTRDENLDILMRVADAVAFAHAKDVIHMDLKPENVMLGQFGEVYVMDWGLASAVQKSGKAKLITETDMIGGTPAYMAPEMAAGKANKINFTSDIYLLGAILFKIITGKPPHAGKDTTSCLNQAIDNIIQDPGFEDAFLPIAYKAMSAKTKGRYQTVAAFQDAVRTCRSHAESHSLLFQAECNLEEAKKNKEYDLFAQSIFAYREALRLWENNKKANHGLIKAQIDFAKVAYQRGDYDLALTLLNEENEDHRALIQDVEYALKNRRERRQRVKLLSRVSKLLSISLILILGVGLCWFYFKTVQIEKAEANARSAFLHEQEARKELDKLRKQLEEALEQSISSSTPRLIRTDVAITPKKSLPKLAEQDLVGQNSNPSFKSSKSNTSLSMDAQETNDKPKLAHVPKKSQAKLSQEDKGEESLIDSEVNPYFLRQTIVTEHKEKEQLQEPNVVRGIKGKNNQSQTPHPVKDSPRFKLLTLLYRSALVQYDLTSAERYAKKISKQKKASSYIQVGDQCLADIDDYKRLLRCVQDGINHNKSKQTIQLNKGHTLTGMTEADSKGTIIIKDANHHLIKKTILDLSNQQLIQFMKQDKALTEVDTKRILALVAFARGHLKEAEKQFNQIQTSNPNFKHHQEILKWQ